MTAPRLRTLALLTGLATACGRPMPVAEAPAAEPAGEPAPEPVAEPAPPPAPPPQTLDAFIARTASKAGSAVFLAGWDPTEEVSCEGFSFCAVECLGGGLGQPCSEATYRLACGRDPVYPIPASPSQARPVECSADGTVCTVDQEGVHAPGSPAPHFRDTFFFDASGVVTGFSRCAEGEACELDPAALHLRAERTCAYWRALEAGALEPAERLGVYASMCADLGGRQRRDLEEHLCGPGVPDLARRFVEEVVEEGGFDGCRIGEGPLFQCWVFGTEAWVLYYFDVTGPESEPRFTLFARATEGRALDDEAGEAARTAAFIERVRAGSSVRVGRVSGISARDRRGVRACRSGEGAR